MTFAEKECNFTQVINYSCGQCCSYPMLCWGMENYVLLIGIGSVCGRGFGLFELGKA